ncbi:hydroxysqualene dehydroxylase HpnE [Melioribacter sp. OK-6-Me]|uniref:hydroxysqualene dehydroxylase HpnE n=1 Tax=unclassified Melioribacter TaxID=2627329 RepID=UPI003EDB4249
MKIIVIGGGLTGLAASVFLSEKGFNVTLLEASPKLGGRAYSIYDPDSNVEFDNGQHLLMGCYRSTIRFLKIIGAQSEIKLLPLKVPFIGPNNKISFLRAVDDFYPLNLIDAILNFSTVNWKSRLKIFTLLLKVKFDKSNSEQSESVYQWLKANRQTEEAIEYFWQVLCVGALNSDIKKSSALIFKNVLRRIFFSGTDGYKFILPRKNLRTMYIDKSKNFILSNGGTIYMSERVLECDIEEGVIKKIITTRKIYDNFDSVVFAVPAHALHKIKFRGHQLKNIPAFEYSPILNVHLVLKENPFTEPYYALLGTDFHWLFNHGKYISITSSSAEKLIKRNNADLLSELYSNLELFFPIFNRKLVQNVKVMKDKRATFVPDNNRLKKNSVFGSDIKNLFIGGDWTIPELPATIESAVLSAEIISRNIENLYRVNDRL